jgi:septal ring factor EnvC (AmiA/AmiB activator)
MATLFYLEGADPREAALDDTRTYLLGRSPACDIRVDANGISRKHAELRYDARVRGWWVVDLQSANGTWVNGERKAEALLKDGDELLCGEARIRFDAGQVEPAPGVPAPVLTPPPLPPRVSASRPSVPSGPATALLRSIPAADAPAAPAPDALAAGYRDALARSEEAREQLQRQVHNLQARLEAAQQEADEQRRESVASEVERNAAEVRAGEAESRLAGLEARAREAVERAEALQHELDAQRARTVLPGAASAEGEGQIARLRIENQSLRTTLASLPDPMELARMHERMAHLEHQLESAPTPLQLLQAEQERDTARTRVRTLEAQAESLTQQVEALHARHQESRADLAALQRRLVELQQDHDALLQQLKHVRHQTEAAEARAQALAGWQGAMARWSEGVRGVLRQQLQQLEAAHEEALEAGIERVRLSLETPAAPPPTPLSLPVTTPAEETLALDLDMDMDMDSMDEEMPVDA